MPITIRPESPADCPAVHSFLTAAFGQRDEADLVDRIRRAPGYDPDLSLIAELDHHIVGHIHFSPITIASSDASTPALALAPVSVLPECQRRGIGSALVRDGLSACRAAGHRLVIVVGHPDYYPRFGFTPAHTFNILPPFDVLPPAFMALALNSGALDGVCGTVRYPAPWGLPA